jgi:hypothetical protein
MLKAHSRLFEHLALVTDLVLIAVCWLGAYFVRFDVFGHVAKPPFSDYALQLLPILVVWGVAYKAFDLYRPYRLGSHMAEWFDIAKASTLGVLVLIAGMTFLFRGYEYSRIVIMIFWVASIISVSFSRAAFREILRFARRHGYNQRYAIVAGSPPPRCCASCTAGATPASSSWGCSATSRRPRGGRCAGSAASRRSAPCWPRSRSTS